MKSGARICNELGFEALAMAASQIEQQQRESERSHIPEQPILFSFDSTSSVELPQLGRLPSFSSVQMHTGTVLANDGETVVL